MEVYCTVLYGTGTLTKYDKPITPKTQKID